MPRIKYYNKNTHQWEYADSQYTVSGGASGESGVLCVTVQGNSHDGYTADKTAEEVYDAYTSGKSVVCNVHDLDGNYAMSLAVVTPSVVLFNCAVLGFLFTLVISDSDKTVELHFTQLITEDDFSELEEWAESLIDEKLVGTVKSVNGQAPDANGNVQISIPDSEGADVFWVTAVHDPMKNETTCKQTPDEIYREYAAGKSVLCELNNDGIKLIMNPTGIWTTQSIFYTCFPDTTMCGLGGLLIREDSVQLIETTLATGGNANVEGEVLCVTISGNEADGYTADKTADEINDAFVAGKYVFCMTNNIDGCLTLPLLASYQGLALFSGAWENGAVGLNIDNSKSVEIFSYDFVKASAVPELQTWVENLVDEKLKDFTPDSGGNVDLAITGATVGQTVRIAEVDERGVPTAWEAVEFSSEGKYELIDTITLEEEMSIEYTQEPNGKPYNFSAASIRVKKAEGITFSKSLTLKTVTSNNRENYLYLPPCTKTDEQWGYAEVKQYKGFWERERAADWSIYNYTATPMLVKIPMYDNKVRNGETIVKITGASIPAGLTIEIWGIRT